MSKRALYLNLLYILLFKYQLMLFNYWLLKMKISLNGAISYILIRKLGDLDRFYKKCVSIYFVLLLTILNMQFYICCITSALIFIFIICFVTVQDVPVIVIDFFVYLIKHDI